MSSEKYPQHPLSNETGWFCLHMPLRPSNGRRDASANAVQMPGRAIAAPVSQRPSMRLLADVLEGLHYLKRERVLLAIGLMAGAINACWSGYLVIMALDAVAPGPLGLPTPAYGLLLVSIGLGSVMGAALTMPVQRWLGKRWAIGLNILGNGLMFLAPALTYNLWLIGAAMLFGGMVGPMWTITAATLQGRIVPTELQGRVNASYRLLSIGASALGPLLAGLLAQFFGLPTAFACLGILTWLQLIPFFWLVTERAMTRRG